MDLDAILERRPRLVLVDELAHTNAPGSRHPKRYQDVEELLAAGIDVYTTLNIQHVESLNDVVAKITRIRVRETVPDSLIDARRRHRGDRPHARGPVQRLRDGKVYVAAPGGARDPALLLARQSDRAARAGAAPHRAARRRADGRLHAQPAPSAAPGRRASACWSASATAPPGRSWCATPAPRRPAARALDGAARRDRQRAARRGGRRDRSPRRCAWPSGSAARRSPSPARTSPPRRSTMPMRRQRHPSDRRQDKAVALDASCCAAPSPQRIIRQADGLSIHVIASAPEPGEAAPRRRRLPTFRRDAAGATPAARSAGARRAAGGARRCTQFVGIVERRPRLPDGGAGQRRDLRAFGRRCSPACSACWPTTSSSCRRSTPSPSPTRRTWSRWCSSPGRGHRQQPRRPRARRRRSRPGSAPGSPRSSTSSAASSPAWHARRRAVGDRAPDRADAEGPRRPAAAGATTGLVGAAPASRRRTCSTRPTSPRRTGPGSNNRAAGRGADTLPGAKRLFLPLQHRPRPGRRRRHRQRRARPAADAGPAAPARRAGRPGRAGDRARSTWPRTSTARGCMAETDRLRSALLTSISHDLRTPLASILGVGEQPGQSTASRWTPTTRADHAAARSRRRPSG